MNKNFKAKTHIKTHRCEQLLKRNKKPYMDTVAIRYGCRYTFYNDDKEKNLWWLDNLETDIEYDVNYMSTICSIIYCPFCGKKLDESEQSE